MADTPASQLPHRYRLRVPTPEPRHSQSPFPRRQKHRPHWVRQKDSSCSQDGRWESVWHKAVAGEPEVETVRTEYVEGIEVVYTCIGISVYC
jgi:hypothetical protein